MYTELIALPPNATRIKCYDFEMHRRPSIRTSQETSFPTVPSVMRNVFAASRTCLLCHYLAMPAISVTKTE
jgi:hypothetical protein